MAFVLAENVREAANAPGASDFELLGAPPGVDSLTFASQIGDGNTTRYTAWGAEGWEIGIGEVSTGATNRILRPGTVLINSSGGTSPIDFQGAVQVACTVSTKDIPHLNEDGDLPARDGRDLGTSGDPWRNLFLSGDANIDGTITASDAELGRPPLVSDVNDVVTTRFFTTTSAVTSNTPPGVTGTAVGLNICRNTSNDDQAQMYFTTSSGNLKAGVWARAGRDNWSAGAPSDWWRFVMENPSGYLYLEASSSVRSKTVAANTSSGATENVFVNSSSGELFRVTSAAKYKYDVEDIDTQHARAFFDGARPVWYRSVCEADPDEWSYYGYIADEVAQIDPRLVHFSDEGEPEGFAYSRVAALLHVIMKEQDARIQALEEQLAALQPGG